MLDHKLFKTMSLSMMTKTALFLISIGLIGAIVLTAWGEKIYPPWKNDYRYVLTNVEEPHSFDPLDADHTNNISTARMIYLTPLEVSDNDSLSSHILTSFHYNQENHTATWVVKDGLSYSDNSPIKTEDVAFAVARMAYTRPGFPVIKYIKGLQEWVKSKTPLQRYPRGIRVDGNKIEIEFDQNVSEPFYRFCLEIFSIIPKKCVDLKTNKIICDEIPTNGQYFITHKNKKEWAFAKNEKLKFEGPEQIIFDYWGTENILERVKTIDDKTVVHSDDATISLQDQKALEKDFEIKAKTATRFVSMLMNPNTQTFSRPECRRAFGYLATESYAKMNKTSPVGSIFAKGMFGYLVLEQLDQNSQFSIQKDLSECLNDLKKTPPRWGIIKNVGHRSNREGVTEEVYRSLGVEIPQPLVLESYNEFYDAFIAGKLDFITFSSGFWPLDMSGDLQMLFTPGLHKALQFMAKDSKFQAMIESIIGNPKNEKLYQDINQYLYDKALARPYSHFKRFYISKNYGLLSKIPVGITSPAPWQLFR